MGDFVIGIGMLLAVFGPLLLIPLTWLLYRLAVRPLLLPRLASKMGEGAARASALMLTVLAVAATLALSYFPGRVEFERLCAGNAVPVIDQRVSAESFYRSRLYPYEARRFLEQHGFAFVEGPNMYGEGFRRYRLDDQGQLDEQRVESLQSRYGVQEKLSLLSHGIWMTEKRVFDMQADRELARAAEIVYRGGPLHLLLGSRAMDSCPDIRSEEGSRDFTTFYDLERLVLRSDR